MRLNSVCIGGRRSSQTQAPSDAVTVEARHQRLLLQTSLTPSGGGHIIGVAGESILDRQSPCPAETGMVEIKRPVYSQDKFGTVYHETAASQERLLRKSFIIDSVFLPSGPGSCRSCSDWARSLLPCVRTLAGYRVRECLAHDLLSGLSTGILRIPQCMAYALLAFLSPVYGLYTAFIAGLVYCILGTSPHLVLSCQGVVTLMVGQAALRFAERSNGTDLHGFQLVGGLDDGNGTLALTQSLTADAVSVITLVVGACQLAFGLLRMGMLTNYLSDPLIGGFTTGAAVELVVSQFPAVVGCQIRVPKEAPLEGSFNNFKTVYYGLASLASFSWPTVCLSACSISFLVLVKLANSRLVRHCPIPVPGELILVVLTSVASSVGRLDLLGVSRVGPVPQGFASPRVPPLMIADVRLLQDCAVIAVVAFTIALSIAKKFALRYDTEIDANQEFLAYGVGNVAGSFAGCFVSTSSMSCSAMHESLGRSQVANLFASGLVLLTILFLGPYFAATPICVLSAIILVNLKSMLCQFGDLPLLWSVSKIDFLLWVVTFASVVCFKVDTGLVTGVAFSLLTIVFRSQWPYACVLGRIPHTDIYKNIAVTPDAKEIDGVKLFRYEGSLYFASAHHFRNSLYLLTGCNPRQLALKQLAYDGNLKRLRHTVEEAMPTLYAEAESKGTGGRCYGSVTLGASPGSQHLRPSASLHHVILDFSCCSFIDSVGLRMLSQVLSDYADAGVTVFLSNTRAAVRFMLSKPSVRRVDLSRLFLSNHDAVSAALSEAQKIEERNWLEFDSRQRFGPVGTVRRHHVSRMPSEVSAEEEYLTGDSLESRPDLRDDAELTSLLQNSTGSARESNRGK